MEQKRPEPGEIGIEESAEEIVSRDDNAVERPKVDIYQTTENLLSGTCGEAEGAKEAGVEFDQDGNVTKETEDIFKEYCDGKIKSLEEEVAKDAEFVNKYKDDRSMRTQLDSGLYMRQVRRQKLEGLYKAKANLSGKWRQEDEKRDL